MTKYFWTLCLAIAAFTFTACSDSDSSDNSAQMKIDKVFLEDAKSNIPDREVEFARLGQLIRIQGSGFIGLKKIYINGYETYFNNALMTDNNVWVTLNGKTPVDKADESVRNTIILYKSDDNQLVYSFTIRAAAPSITSVDNTLPMAGELVTVSGSNLQETTKVTLPDGTEITDGIVSDEDGEWFTFTVPASADLSVAGSITSEGANGTAVSASYFNYSDAILIDFDGVSGHGVHSSWGSSSSMIKSDDLVDDPLNSGRGKVCQLIPERLIGDGISAETTRAIEVWNGGADDPTDNWLQFFDASTPITDLAFQFDIYVPEEWSLTGYIQVTMCNNLNWTGYGTENSNAVAYWIPWLVDSEVVPFKTDGWKTITIPLSEFTRWKSDVADGKEVTFGDVQEYRLTPDYRNVGIGFVNGNLKIDDVEYPSQNSKQLIYVDNLRLVSIKTSIVSDFNDTEE